MLRNTFTNALAKEPTAYTSYDDIARLLKNPQRLPAIADKSLKTELPLVIPTGFKRKGEGFIATDYVLADIDGGLSIDEARACLMDTDYLLYTTASHSEDAPRFRIAVRVSPKIETAEQYTATMRALDNTLKGNIDPSVIENHAQGSFLPAVVAGVKPITAKGGDRPYGRREPAGTTVVVKELFDFSPDEVQPLPLADLERYLSFVDGSTYERWIATVVRVAASVSHGAIDAEEAYGALDEWSKRFGGYDPIANRKKFERELDRQHGEEKVIIPYFPDDDEVVVQQENNTGPLWPDLNFNWVFDVGEAPPLKVENLLPEDGHLLIYAQSGVGKSWVSMALASLMATGDQQSDWKVPKRQKVLYIEGEMSWRDVGRRFKMMHEGYPGIEENLIPVSLLHPHASPINFSNGFDVDRLCNYVKEHGVQVVFLDNILNLWASEHSSNSSEYGREISKVLLALSKVGAVAVVVHHTNKEGSNFLGSSTIMNAFSTALYLEKDKGFDAWENPVWCYTVTKQREPICPSGQVVFNRGSGALRIDVFTGGTDAAPKQKSKPLASREGLDPTIAALIGDITTIEDLSKKAGRNKDLIPDIFWRLVELNEIDATDSAKRKKRLRVENWLKKERILV